MSQIEADKDFETLLLEFEGWAIGTGTYSPTSARAAVRSLKFMNRAFDVVAAKNEDVLKFSRSQIMKGRVHKTVENQLQALFYFQKFLGNQIQVPKFRKQRTPDQWVPSDEDMRQVFRYVDSIPNPSDRAYSRALIYVCAYTGARIGEIARLNIGDVMEETIYIRAEKNESPRSLGIPNFVYRIVRDYVETYRMATDQKALFTGKRGRNTPDYLRTKIKKIGRSAGVPMLHSHAFRHRVATTLLNAGMDLAQVQYQLGHISPLSTKAYDHSDRVALGRQNSKVLEQYYTRGNVGVNRFEGMCGNVKVSAGRGIRTLALIRETA